MKSQIVQFYSGEGSDHIGRSLETILSYTDENLEMMHDYIQWLFPLEKLSPVNPSAPAVGRDTQIEFRNNTSLRSNLCRACRRMLRFYGLSCTVAAFPSQRIRPDRDFVVKSRNWMTPFNHNHLRLTRILKSLRLLGLASCSGSLLQCLEELAMSHPNQISPETIDYWRSSHHREHQGVKSALDP